jgi:pectinesterase
MKIVRKILAVVLLLVLVQSQVFAGDPIVVSQDNKGDFKTIQAAINSLPEGEKQQRIIIIKKGTYQEKVFIDKDFITLKGEDAANTIVNISLARDEWRCSNADDYGTATINLKGSDIILENLSFINSYGRDNKTDRNISCANDNTGSKLVKPTTHQMALRSFGTTRLVVVNCIFRAWGGDTVSPWNTENGMFYFKNCIMEGGVDFYCPRGWALADNCTFICQQSPAGIWHDGSKYESSKTVLLNCKFSGDDNFKLGRYHRDAQFYLLNCSFAKNMADTDIYLVPTNNTILWGRRVYYYNCHRIGGDYAWHKNNLPQILALMNLIYPGYMIINGTLLQS